MCSKESKVLWLSQEECIEAGALDMLMVLKNVENANLWLAEGKTTETDLVHLVWEPGAYASKRIGISSALIRAEETRVGAIKGIPSNPENPLKRGLPRSNGLVILYNEDTGLPISVMDGTIISSMRTGASSAIGAKYCANPDSEVLGLVGCGVIQDTCIEATSLVMKNIKTVRLYDTNKEKAEKFAGKWAAKLGYTFEICNQAEQAVADSDIVHTCTNVNLGQEYIKKEWIKKGSFHSAVSMWDYRDEAILQGCNKYCMDWKYRLKDRKYPLTELSISGRLDPREIVELGEIISGKSRCRESHDDAVFFATLGLCITDTANAYQIYQNALAKGLGTQVYQWKSPYNF
ncbi:MAG: ornithine cyclodeaminase family protein [Dehalobacterium sp.]